MENAGEKLNMSIIFLMICQVSVDSSQTAERYYFYRGSAREERCRLADIRSPVIDCPVGAAGQHQTIRQAKVLRPVSGQFTLGADGREVEIFVKSIHELSNT